MAGDKMNSAQRAETTRSYMSELSDIRDPLDAKKVAVRNAVDYTDDWFAGSLTSTGTENRQYRVDLPAPFKVASSNPQKDRMMRVVLRQRDKNGVL